MKSGPILLQVAAGVWFASAIAHPSATVAQTTPSDHPNQGTPAGAPPTSLSPSTASQAGSAEAPQNSGIQDIVVTARRTTENLQKAPAAIVAVSGDQLTAAGITTPQKLELVVPGANLRTEGAVTQAFIRGVGSNVDDPNVSPAVVFVFNGIPISHFGTQGLLFDVANVQVISGPQGTLYGGTAAGGAINVNTVQPLNDYSGNGSIEGGNYADFRVNAGQNIPLGQDLSLRVDGGYSHHSGYLGRGFEAENKIQGRVSLLYKPSSNFKALLFYSGSRENGQPPNTENIPLLKPSDPWYQPANGAVFGNPFDTSLTHQLQVTHIVGANIEFKLGDNVFTYIPAFVRVLDDYRQYDAGLPLSSRDAEKQVSQELRWNRNAGRFKLSGGLFFLHDDTEFKASIGLPLTGAPPFPLIEVPLTNIPKQLNINYSAYGQAIFSASDRLRLTVGGRYSHDRISVPSEQAIVGFNYPSFSFSRNKNREDWKVGVDLDLTDRILTYANIQTGYVPFGYGRFPNSPTQSNYIPPSDLLGYSAGIKSRFLDNHLELNVEGYYYKYKNFHAVDFNGITGLTTIVPAQGSRIYGVEVLLRALLPHDIQIDAGANVMSAHYTRFSGVGPDGTAFNYAGNQLIDAPTATVNGGVQKDIALGNGTVRGRADVHGESSHWGTYFHAPYTQQGAFAKVDLTLSYLGSGERWTVQGFVNNLTDKAVFGALAVGGQPGPAAGFLEAPRTFGVRLTTKW